MSLISLVRTLLIGRPFEVEHLINKNVFRQHSRVDYFYEIIYDTSRFINFILMYVKQLSLYLQFIQCLYF